MANWPQSPQFRGKPMSRFASKTSSTASRLKLGSICPKTSWPEMASISEKSTALSMPTADVIPAVFPGSIWVCRTLWDCTPADVDLDPTSNGTGLAASLVVKLVAARSISLSTRSPSPATTFALQKWSPYFRNISQFRLNELMALARNMASRLCLIFLYSTLRASETAYGMKGMGLR